MLDESADNLSTGYWTDLLVDEAAPERRSPSRSVRSALGPGSWEPEGGPFGRGGGQGEKNPAGMEA